MENVIDVFSDMKTIVRFKPISKLSFIAEELRRYGIKTNKKINDKTIFYQSAHIVIKDNNSDETGLEFALVGFKDLFKKIGKNDNCDNQDIMRVWIIARKLEKRGMIEIIGSHDSYFGSEENPKDLPDCYVNLCHIYRKTDEINDYVYMSKFASDRVYAINENEKIVAVSDYFYIVG